MNATAITARRGYTDLRHAPIDNIAVVVSEGRIAYAGPAIAAPPTSATIDLGEAVLIPGLMDGHVHLHFDAGPDPVGSSGDADDVLAERARRAMTGLLQSGVTTARDLGSRSLGGPQADPALRLLAAGRPLTSPGGHCWPMGGVCADEHAALGAVERAAESGATWIKIMMSGGFLTADTVVDMPQFSLSTTNAIVAEAHRLGLRVAAHAHGAQAILRSALAGVDTIEHGTFLGSAESEEPDPEILSVVLDSGAAVCPTANSATGTYPEETGRRALRRTAAAVEQGLPLVVGTDAGVRAVDTRHYARSLAELRRAGLDARTVWTAATSGAADALGLADSAGRLAAGLSADVVALAADPVEDPDGATATWVMSQGTVQLERAGVEGGIR